MKVGVVDIDKARAKQVAERYEVEHYTDYREIIDKVDAVSIAVPTQLHEKVATDFLSTGVNVLLEKPIATTLDEAERIIDAAYKNDVILQLGHVERFNPAITELKKIFEEEKPVLIEGRRMGPYPPRMSSIGVIIDLMIHDIDVVRYLLVLHQILIH